MGGAGSAASLMLLVACSIGSISCRWPQNSSNPAIVFSRIPEADRGGPDGFEPIQGQVLRVHPGERIVVYAHSGGLWWLQPNSSRPFTEIKPDLTWKSIVHLGDRYAALPSPCTANLIDFRNERNSPFPIKRKEQNYGKSTQT